MFIFPNKCHLQWILQIFTMSQEGNESYQHNNAQGSLSSSLCDVRQTISLISIVSTQRAAVKFEFVGFYFASLMKWTILPYVPATSANPFAAAVTMNEKELTFVVLRLCQFSEKIAFEFNFRQVNDLFSLFYFLNILLFVRIYNVHSISRLFPKSYQSGVFKEEQITYNYQWHSNTDGTVSSIYYVSLTYKRKDRV